jgi:hypothetical protein
LKTFAKIVSEVHIIFVGSRAERRFGKKDGTGDEKHFNHLIHKNIVSAADVLELERGAVLLF